MERNIKHLVVDSGAFIKNAPIHEYAENIYTVDGTVKEIKDKATLRRLQFLPYKLQVKQPEPEAVRFVTDFAKKTGDYASLSVVDLQLAALTYQLQKEHASEEPICSEPTSQVTTKPIDNAPLIGFYYPKEKNKIEENHKNDSKEDDPFGDDAEEDDDEEDDRSDDEDAWITAEDLKNSLDDLSLDSKASMEVACITTDFAIQNIILQMGLHVISVDGMLIRNTRVYILRCFSCYKTTNDVTKKFCFNCGNKTLKRVAVSVNEDGSKNIHINFKRPINVRGTKFSLPTPKGGKHSNNPITCADQRLPQNRLPKSHRIGALEENYEAQWSPFAVNDVYSRAARLGIGRGGVPQHSRRNPNVSVSKFGNKKKK